MQCDNGPVSLYQVLNIAVLPDEGDWRPKRVAANTLSFIYVYKCVREGDRLEDLGITWEDKIKTDLGQVGWLRIGTGGGVLWMR